MKTGRVRILVTMLVALTACSNEPAPASSPTASAGQVAPASAAPKVSFYAASRFAEQASFGPTPALVAELQAKGFEKWIDEQFALPATPLDMRFIDWNLGGGQPNVYTLFAGEVLRTFISAPDQLRWRITWSLAQFIVVSSQKLDPAGVGLWANDLHRMALGNYGALLRGVTLSSPMGFYLDNDQNSAKSASCPHCVPNENYARELMQLFSLGVWALNADGTPKRDARGQFVETYSQVDVEELARVLTGWRHDTVRVPDTPRNWGSWSRPMVPSGHAPDRDSGRKQVLGRVFPAGQTIYQDLDDLVAMLMGHPNIAPFVSLRLIQHLVKSDPSPAYMLRIGAVFRDNGRGVAGDLKAVVKAILLDPEARRGDDSNRALPGDGKLREPMLQRTGLLRGLGCRTVPLQHWDGQPWQLGTQQPFSPMSVFGFYAPTDRAPGSNLLAPEQKVLIPRTLRERLDALDYLAGREVLAGKPLLDAGCVLEDFIAAYRRSPADLMRLVGQRYLRGADPQQLTPLATQLVRQWGGPPTHPWHPQQHTTRLIEFALIGEAYGVMP